MGGKGGSGCRVEWEGRGGFQGVELNGGEGEGQNRFVHDGLDASAQVVQIHLESQPP